MQEIKAITLAMHTDCLILYRIESQYKSWIENKVLRVNHLGTKIHSGTLVVIITGHTLLALMQGAASEGNGPA